MYNKLLQVRLGFDYESAYIGLIGFVHTSVAEDHFQLTVHLLLRDSFVPIAGRSLVEQSEHKKNSKGMTVILGRDLYCTFCLCAI
jgi:hypothetical protein